MNAKHTEKHYPSINPDHHFLLVSMRQAERFYSELHKHEEIFVKVKLPFACEIHGFYDPIDNVEDFLDFGIYSLDYTSDIIVADVPPSSTKFLNLFCEKKKRPKIKQKRSTKSYGFSLPSSCGSSSNSTPT